MKKILALLMCIIGMFSLTACGAGDVGGPGYNPSSATEEETSSETQPLQVDMSKYEDNLDGLVSYMKDLGCIEGEPVTMADSIIGAKAGYRYDFVYERVNISVELYEYDLDNLNDTAREILNGDNENTSFTIDKNQVDAVVNNTGKYLMIYNTSKTNDVITEKESYTKEKFKAFKEESSQNNSESQVVSQ